MRAVYVILSVAICFMSGAFGYIIRQRESPLRKSRERDIALAVASYHAVRATNWATLSSTVGMQVVGLTRDYERRFGTADSATAFAPRFREAQRIAAEVGSNLVTVGSIITSLPLAPTAAITGRNAP